MTYYVIKNEDGSTERIDFKPMTRDDITYRISDKELDELNEDAFFSRVSKIIAFDDYTNVDVIQIVYKGRHYHYAGWQPGMLFEYYDADGNTVWVGEFPRWDH